MSTHNTCFCGDMKKYLHEYPRLSGAMSVCSLLEKISISPDKTNNGYGDIIL